MDWLELAIPCQPAHTTALEEALLAAGALSVSYADNADEPILEPAVGETPLWQQTLIKALFSANTDMDMTMLLITAELGYTPAGSRWEILENRDWERVWMDSYQPMQFGKKLWICPSWQTPPDQSAVNLMLDPGLAFGTGTHPTTALCLYWLDEQPLMGKTVIDYGCGSGILGIAAVLLGARQFIGVDNDPQALLASRDNAQRNGLAHHQLQLFLPEDLPNAIHADVLIANILAKPLLELSEIFAKLLVSNGKIALSGILLSQQNILEQCYSDKFELAESQQQDEWIMLHGIKR